VLPVGVHIRRPGINTNTTNQETWNRTNTANQETAIKQTHPISLTCNKNKKKLPPFSGNIEICNYTELVVSD